MARDKKILPGVSVEIGRLNRAVRTLASRSEPVLILGEAGSGRSYLAEALHRGGSRHSAPYRVGDCATLERDFFMPPGGDLFVKDNGTLHLDGLERLPSDLQNRLYKALSADEEISVRLIASATPEIDRMARKKEFRMDLLQRLNATRLELPPLRDRKADIPVLIQHFLAEFCAELGKPVPDLPGELFEAIIDYDWPGNVAELRNCVRNLIIMSPEGELSPAYLPFRVQSNPLEVLAGVDLSTAIAEVERFLIRRALIRFDGNQSKAARALKVSEAALRYKMKKYGLPAGR